MISPAIARADITGVVLAGGRGSRMGGVDKGLLPCTGGSVPLALHALRRLGPQVGRAMVSANRHLDAYRAFGVPVVADEATDGAAPRFDGPLAGMLAALGRCETPWLVTVPCDAPRFPLDLVERLAAGLLAADARAAQVAQVAIACTRPDGRAPRAHPVFCLMPAAVAPSLRDALRAGEHGVLRWAEAQCAARVEFEDHAFFNANTPAELHP